MWFLTSEVPLPGERSRERQRGRDREKQGEGEERKRERGRGKRRERVEPWWLARPAALPPPYPFELHSENLY